MAGVAKRNSALSHDEPLLFDTLEQARAAMVRQHPHFRVTLVPMRGRGGEFWRQIMPESRFGYRRESVIEETLAPLGTEVSPLEVRVRRSIVVGPHEQAPELDSGCDSYLVLIRPRLRLLRTV